jgi:hypothetical protein
MEMASFSLKIRHVFGDTLLTERSIGAGPPVIIQLCDIAIFFDLCVMRQRIGTSARFERKAKRKAKSWRKKDCCATVKDRAKIEVKPFLM